MCKWFSLYMVRFHNWRANNHTALDPTQLLMAKVTCLILDSWNSQFSTDVWTQQAFKCHWQQKQANNLYFEILSSDPCTCWLIYVVYGPSTSGEPLKIYEKKKQSSMQKTGIPQHHSYLSHTCSLLSNMGSVPQEKCTCHSWTRRPRWPHQP